jgi:anti-sigma-K factor RskA
MTEEHQPMEQLLRQIQPSAPNTELRERIAADLKLDSQWLPAASRRLPRWTSALAWASMGAAAAIMIMSVISGPRQHLTTPDQSRLQASSQSQSTENPKPSTQPQVQIWSVERHAWIDQDGAEVIWEIPHQERVLLPVQFQ